MLRLNTPKCFGLHITSIFNSPLQMVPYRPNCSCSRCTCKRYSNA